MEEQIYIELLDEGTKVYRPVPSIKVDKNVYKVGGFDIYGEDELWAFPPGTIVYVEKRKISDEILLVAVEKISDFEA
jgi:hypothetical protein